MKKILKNITLAALVATLVLSLFACTKPTESPAETSTDRSLLSDVSEESGTAVTDSDSSDVIEIVETQEQETVGSADSTNEQDEPKSTVRSSVATEVQVAVPTDVKRSEQTSVRKTTAVTGAPTATTATTTKPAPATVRVILSVNCSAAVQAGNSTAKQISDNGVIMGSKAFELKQGSTAMDLILQSGLAVGERGGYIYSIQSLGEFDVNGKGGWYYYVNGSRPGYGAAQYVLQPGDQVSFEYTLDY
jgi:hypothetical protein